MYRVQVLLRSVELPTQKTWKTKKQAEEVRRLYQVFFKAQGAKNFKVKVMKI